MEGNRISTGDSCGSYGVMIRLYRVIFLVLVYAIALPLWERVLIWFTDHADNLKHSKIYYEEVLFYLYFFGLIGWVLVLCASAGVSYLWVAERHTKSFF